MRISMSMKKSRCRSSRRLGSANVIMSPHNGSAQGNDGRGKQYFIENIGRLRVAVASQRVQARRRGGLNINAPFRGIGWQSSNVDVCTGWLGDEVEANLVAASAYVQEAAAQARNSSRFRSTGAARGSGRACATTRLKSITGAATTFKPCAGN